MFEFNWDSLNYIFTRLYNFFISLVYQFNKPFEDFFTINRFYNIFDGNYYSIGLPDGVLTDVLDFLNRFALAILEPILNILGLTLQEPAWVCFLALIPALVIIVGVIRVVTNVINN